MDERIAFLRDRPGLLPALESRCQGPFDLVVPYVGAALSARALAAAWKLVDGFDANVTLMAVYVLPFPAPLECQPGVRQRLEAELAAVVRALPVPPRVELVFARDREETFFSLLRRESLVVIGTKDRWWRTREERFARKLAARGHSVAVIKVK